MMRCDRQPQSLNIRYTFRFENGASRIFELSLDGATLELMRSPRSDYPAWAELGFCRCPSCPLDEAVHRYCPIALNLVDLMETFGEKISYETAEVVIETEARIFMKKTSIQQALSSLIGLYMATGRCPIMGRLKPMVRFHLPFADEFETKYRAISMYLFAQYFRYKRGETPDWDLVNLVRLYEDIREVNRYFFKRISAAKKEDASVNAIVILDCFADSVNFSISRKMMEEIEILFEAYQDK